MTSSKKQSEFKDPFLSLCANDADQIEITSESSEDTDDKKLRIAEEYLNSAKINLGKKRKLENKKFNEIESLEENEEIDDNELNKYLISEKQSEGIDSIDTSQINSNTKFNLKEIGKQYRPITSHCIIPKKQQLITGCKGGILCKWDLKLAKRLNKINRARGESDKGHSKAILALSCSPNGKFFVSGGEDKLIFVWDTEKMEILHKFKGHRFAINSLKISVDSNYLYSGDINGSIRSWSLKSMDFIETLFGHDKAITSIDTIESNKILSVSSDQTIRFFKIETGTQLVFKTFETHSSSLDTCSLLNKREFIVGSQDGGISLWTSGKRSPCFVLKNAHGGKWISSVCALKNSDLIISGSSDGFLRLWRRVRKEGEKKMNFEIEEISKIAVNGWINALSFDWENKVIVISSGKEHRLGRWQVENKAENKIYLASFE